MSQNNSWISKESLPRRIAVLYRTALFRSDLLVPLILLFISLLTLLLNNEFTIFRPDRAIFTFDSAEYAVAGRHLSRTGWLKTPFAHPEALYEYNSPPFPYIVGHPMVPLLNAAVFLIGGEREVLTLVPPGILYLLLVMLAYLFAYKLSGSRPAAAAIAVAVTFNSYILRYSSEGLSEMPFMAAFFGAVVLLWSMRDRPRPVALGIVLGLAHFTRPVVLPLFPFWLIAAALMVPDGRWKTAGKVAAGFLPWVILIVVHRYMSTGDPFADIGPARMLTGLSPELTTGQMPRYLALPSPFEYIRQHPNAFIRKIATNGPLMLKGAFMDRSIALLFLLYLFSPVWHRAEKIFRAALVLSVLVLVALVTITVPQTRYFHPLLPVYLVLGLTELHSLIRARGSSEWLASVTIVALSSFFFVMPTLVHWQKTEASGKPAQGVFTEEEWESFGAGLKKVLPEDTVTTSDVAPWVCWYADRPSILLPVTPKETEAMRKVVDVDAVILTNEFIVYAPRNEEWNRIFHNPQTFENWALSDSIRFGNGRSYVYFPASGALNPDSLTCPFH